MSLDWDISLVADWEEKRAEDRGLLDILIWGDLAVQMNGIPKGKVDEVYFRYLLMERAGITHIIQTDDEGNKTSRNPTLEEIQRWEGLRTNVTTVKRPSWVRYIGKRLERETEDSLFYEKRKAEEAASAA
jgi:hypothetical protein